MFTERTRQAVADCGLDLTFADEADVAGAAARNHSGAQRSDTATSFAQVDVEAG